ncbi:hypothetical protein IWQ60_002284 [Tieghemiomyces parasiticus]|uniref:Uncharacterized protein n=1 Tax=Tieghemiomyces parasiticus TaxID=78921 RepID=A0A9W8ACI8_9FUNG|nr:hypothetical protein IWQ60_002284 [Tieghemiomyces parasiticus]
MTANDLRTSANLVNEALAVTVDPPQATQRTLSRPSVVNLTTWHLLQPWNCQALAFTWWLFAETVVSYLGQSIFHSLTTFAPGTDPSLATRRIVDLWPRYLSTHLGPRGWPIDPVGPMAPSRVTTQSSSGSSAAERPDHSPDGYGEVDAHVYARAERPAIDTLRQNSPQARLLRIQEFCEAFTY